MTITNLDTIKHRSLDSLGTKIQGLIEDYVSSTRLTYDEVIGCLEIIKFNYLKDLLTEE